MAEGDTTLPAGWGSAPLSDVAEIIMGQSPPSSTYNRDGRGLPFFQGKAEFGDLYPEPRVWCSSPGKVAEAEDILLSVRAPVGPTNLAPSKSCIGRGLAAVRPARGIERRYVLYAIRAFVSELTRQGTGTTFKAVSGKQVRGFEIPVAPSLEQARIAEKLDELLTGLDKGVEALERVRRNLERYRASVLKAAFEGKLTEEWRKAELANPDSLLRKEPASLLLERIKAERAKATSGNRRGRRELPPVDTSELPELPEGWVWARGDDIFVFITSGSRGWAKHYSESGPLFLRMGNLDHASITLDLANVQRVSPPLGSEGRRTQVQPGDILISITADTGMVGLVPDGLGEAYVNQHVALARPVATLNGACAAWQLASRDGGQRQFRRLQRGATKTGLGLDDIRALRIALPPVAEQERMVSEIERMFSLADAVQDTIDRDLGQTSRLRQSIFKTAFEGRLVPQDPSDEPASALLERIRAARAQNTVGKARAAKKKAIQRGARK